MDGGQITQTTITWIEGFLGVLVLLGIVLVFYINLRKIKYQAESEKIKAKVDADALARSEVDKAVAEAKKETASEMAFRDLQRSVESMTLTVKCLNESMQREITTIKDADISRVKWITEVEATARSAHRRIDEHKVVDHGHAPNHFSEPPRHAVSVKREEDERG